MRRTASHGTVIGMPRIRSSVLLAVCLLALMGAAAAHAQVPLQASFESVPDAPEIGQQITLTDTTKGPGPLERAWDLDGDGEYDDGAGATATVSFPTAGDHDVALRVRRLGAAVQTSVVRKTIT